ncbi:MAG: hypothetical protein WC464_06485, partial [Bdellovibrionales bacterium]
MGREILNIQINPVFRQRCDNGGVFPLKAANFSEARLSCRKNSISFRYHEKSSLIRFRFPDGAAKLSRASSAADKGNKDVYLTVGRFYGDGSR